VTTRVRLVVDERRVAGDFRAAAAVPAPAAGLLDVEDDDLEGASVLPSSFESLYSENASRSFSLTRSWDSMRDVSSLPRSFSSSAVQTSLTDLNAPIGPDGSWLTFRVGPDEPQAAPTMAATSSVATRADVGATRAKKDFIRVSPK
jgi:hypothetical protein